MTINIPEQVELLPVALIVGGAIVSRTGDGPTLSMLVGGIVMVMGFVMLIF